MPTVVAVLAASGPHELPGIEACPAGVELRYIPAGAESEAALAGADVLFSWDYRGHMLAKLLPTADRLRWIHQAGAGVDAVLSPEVAAGDVLVTNSAGVFDEPIAEFVLGLVLAFAKGFPESWAHQRSHHWQHRLNEKVAGGRAVVVGVGGIGRATCRLLRAVGMDVTPVGRSSRQDPQLGQVHTVSELTTLVAHADVVVAATPLTRATRGLFGADFFTAMSDHARFINVGRGALVDEAALLAALHNGDIAGAGLDVFSVEPLPADSPFWDLPNVVITPHHAGDYVSHREALVQTFLENLQAWIDDEPLHNVVDKRLGFVANR